MLDPSGGCLGNGSEPDDVLGSGDDILGIAGPFGGGGGGVGVPRRWPPKGEARFCGFGGPTIVPAGAIDGVPLLEMEGFVTIGVSFQFVMSLALDGGACGGPELLGGAPN